MTPNDRDLAELAQLGMRMGVLTPQMVSAWADEIILEREDPPTWAIELSTADVNKAIHLLNIIPEKPTNDLPVLLLGAFVQRLWRQGKLSVQQVRDIGWQLHLEDRLPWEEGQGDWGVVLYCEFEEFKNGYRTEDQMQASIEQKLVPYAVYEDYLPPCWSGRFRRN